MQNSVSNYLKAFGSRVVAGMRCGLLALALLLPMLAGAQPVRLKAGGLSVAIDRFGFYGSICVNGKEVLREKAMYPVVSAVDGAVVMPQSVTMRHDTLACVMDDDSQVLLRLRASDVCITMEVLECPQRYSALLFGPVAVKLDEVVGDIVGVVQGGKEAFGMMGLNAKTLGGMPPECAELVADRFHYQGMDAATSTSSLPSWHLTATRIGDGAMMQLSCRRRYPKGHPEMSDVREVQQCKAALVKSVEGPDGGITGAKVALFGCSRSQALETIGRIEQQEGLPHPLIDGVWAKQSRKSMASYLISDFTANDLDYVLDQCTKAGWEYLYHIDPFSDWGHFHWDTSLAHSDSEMRALVQRVERRGVKMGVHTLSNFITTNDAYVTPVPSKHLLTQMEMSLAADIDAEAADIAVIQPPAVDWDGTHSFKTPSTLHALLADDEIIVYQGGFDTLKDCLRGAFGTRAAPHARNCRLKKLWDHPYETLFPDLTLQDSMADRLAELFNNTGLAQTSFDGLEGCTYTGQDEYAMARFVERCWRGWDHDVINDASRLEHYTWHVHTRMNWGEPWGDEMRTGQVENRIKNQDFFSRNLLPRMLGWFLIRTADKRFEATALEDLEWAMSEAVGLDGGYGMTCYMKTLRNHGQIDQLLEAVRLWDSLRMNNAFSDELKARLRRTETEWHLQREKEGHCTLFPLYVSPRYRCDLAEMQPGQPGGADWSWTSPKRGSYSLRLHVTDGGSIVHPTLRTELGTLSFDCTVKSGQYLLLDAEGNVVLTDQNYNVLKKISYQGNALLPEGASAVSFSCRSQADKEGVLPTVELRYVVREDGIAIP